MIFQEALPQRLIYKKEMEEEIGIAEAKNEAPQRACIRQGPRANSSQISLKALRSQVLKLLTEGLLK